MRMLGAVGVAVVMGLCASVYAAGPDWPTDKYKAFEEAKKKNKLLFLYYHSSS
jgi:hypothetical protein